MRGSRTRFANRVGESVCPLKGSDHNGKRDEPGVVDRSAVCELIARDDPPRNGRFTAGQTVVIRKTRRCGLIFPRLRCASVPERQGRCQPPLLHVKQRDREQEIENERSPGCASLLNGHVGRGDHRPVGALRSSLRCGLSYRGRVAASRHDRSHVPIPQSSDARVGISWRLLLRRVGEFDCGVALPFPPCGDRSRSV